MVLGITYFCLYIHLSWKISQQNSIHICSFWKLNEKLLNIEVRDEKFWYWQYFVLYVNKKLIYYWNF